MKKAVVTDKAPKAIGPYSQAIISGNLVFTSGQIPIDPVTGNLETGSIEEQAHLVFKNLAAVLKAARSGLEKAIKVTVFLKDMNNFAKVNDIYSQYFKGVFPARSAVEVARLPKDVDIEVEAIAYV
jgi:2-iminobutanoate/2-iminopropanoate deaminase